MASELNPYGVGGLEIWQYSDRWIKSTTDEIRQLKEEFEKLQTSICSAVQR
jgi:hypothetical protein